jgi:glycosyltransferase involved in cell wall biosynthesis
MQSELVSVIIPTYNRASTLARAIESVLKQTYGNLELIVVDDNSNDETSRVASGITDERIKYIQFSKNKGVAAARNAGIKESCGDYIAFLDSDDQWLPDKLKLSLEVFKNNSDLNIGLVYTNGWDFKNGQKSSIYKTPNFSCNVYGNKQRKKNIFPTRVVSPFPSFWMLPKDVVSKVGFFDEKMRNWEDVDFFVRIARNFDIYFLNSFLSIKYHQDQSLSRLTVTVMRCKEHFREKHIKWLSDDNWSVYRFTWRMGKDWLALGDKKLARKYFWKTLKEKPYKIEIIGKICKTLCRGKKSKKLFISFLNTPVCLRTNSNAYYLFLKEYFAPLVVNLELDKCKVFIDIFWEHKHWKQRVDNHVSKKCTRAGANTYISEKMAGTVFKEKEKIFFSWQEKENIIKSKAIIRSYLHKNKFSFLTKKIKQKEYFYQLTLKSIYYPLFYYFRKKNNFIVLHASAIRYKNKGIIFSGLDGVGKTSCALSLIDSKEAFLLSDNLVLVGGNKIHSCYEQIRLHKNKNNSEKEFYLLPEEKMVQESPVNLIFFTESASSNNIIPISLDQAVQRTVNLSRLSGELQKYPIFSSVYNLALNDNLISEKKILKSAFTNARFFRIQMDFSLGLEHNTKFLKEKINSIIWRGNHG